MLYMELLGIFTLGLLGSGHCLGMCGGIASALSITSKKTTTPALHSLAYSAQGGETIPSVSSLNSRPTQSHRALVSYNVGRLFSYAIIGGSVGGFIATAAHISHLTHHLHFLRVVAGIMMILVALHIGQIWQGLTYVERLGTRIWRKLSPFASRFLTVRNNKEAVALGMIWGWLPCGLVYSALTLAAVSGSAINGALMMMAFGLGTLPAMLLVGHFSQRMKTWLNNIIIRRTFAFLLFLYAIFTLLMLFSH